MKQQLQEGVLPKGAAATEPPAAQQIGLPLLRDIAGAVLLTRSCLFPLSWSQGA